MIAALLALATALTWGCADFLGGLKTRALPLLVVLLVAQGTGVVAAGILVATSGAEAPGRGQLLAALAAGAALTIGVGALYQGLATGPMAVVAPIAATGAVVPLAVGLARGERPEPVQLAGVGLALVGVVLVSRETPVDKLGDARLGVGVLLGLLAALGIGIFFVAMDAAAGGGVFWAALVQRAAAVVLIAAAIPVARPSLRLRARDLPALGAIGILDLAAIACFAAASTRGLTSLVAVLASLYPVTTLALARIVLGERSPPLRLAGAALALAGVVFITAG